MKRNACCTLVAVVALGLFSASAEAAPLVLGDAYDLVFSGETCFTCFPYPATANVTIEGHLTVAPGTGGQFWDPVPGDYTGLYPGALMVLGITGTLTIDCTGFQGCTGGGTYSLSFVPPNPAGDGWSAPLGDGSWVDTITPQYLVFSAVGSGFDTRIINDNAENLLQWDTQQVPIHWETKVPEPSSLSLLAFGLAGLVTMRRKTRLRPTRQ